MRKVCDISDLLERSTDRVVAIKAQLDVYEKLIPPELLDQFLRRRLINTDLNTVDPV